MVLVVIQALSCRIRRECGGTTQALAFDTYGYDFSLMKEGETMILKELSIR